MESKYWLEITALRAGYRLFEGKEIQIEGAIRRIQDRIKKGATIVAVHIKNPRYTGSF